MIEKKDEQLFFVQSEAADIEGSVRTPRSQRRKRPLRSHAHLRRDPVINGFPSLAANSAGQIEAVGKEASEGKRRARDLWSRLNGVTDSSEDEQEYEVSSRFAVKRRTEERELAKAVCKRLDKSRLKPVARDLWADVEDGMTQSLVPPFWVHCKYLFC